MRKPLPVGGRRRAPCRVFSPAPRSRDRGTISCMPGSAARTREVRACSVRCGGRRYFRARPLGLGSSGATRRARREPPAPSAEETRPVRTNRWRSSRPTGTARQHSSCLPRALPRAGSTRRLGVRGGGRFSRPPRGGTRGTPRPLDRSARERDGSRTRVDSSSGVVRRTYRSAFIARSSESERPGTRVPRRSPPYGGAGAKCVDRGRANPACQRRAPGDSTRRRAPKFDARE